MTRVRSTVLVVFLALGFTACSSAAASDEPPPPARVVRVHGTKVRRIILTPRAVHRLGLRTVPVAAASTGLTVPYSALIYDPQGRTWVYAQVRPRTFQRARVTVDRIEGDTAVVSAAPPAGTKVVSVATAEVYGTEFFSGHE
jgi:hypothetical protein